MTNTDYIIREIEPRDNDQVKTIVQHVILEMGMASQNGGNLECSPMF